MALYDPLIDWIAEAVAARQPEPETRADAVASAYQDIGFLDSKDREGRPAPVAWLTEPEIDNLVTTSGLARRIVYAPAEDSTARGWRVDADEDRDVTAELDAALDVEARITKADALARRYGGALVWMVTKGDDDLSEPLGEGPHDVVALHVFDATECTPVAWEDDPASPAWGKPSVWSITPQREGIAPPSFRVHRSRVLYVPGAPMPDSEASPPFFYGFDLSIVQLYWEALRDLGMSERSAVALMRESSLLFLSMPSGQTVSAGDDRSAFQRTIAALKKRFGPNRLGLLFGDSKVERINASFAGVRDLLTSGYERVASVEGIPLSRLVGQPPAGLSTDDAAGQRTYQDFVARRQRTHLTPVLRALYDVALGPAPRDIYWPPLDTPTDRESAETEKLRAEAASIRTGGAPVTSPDEERTRLTGSEVLAMPVIEDVPMDDPTPDEIAEYEAGLQADAETYAVPEAARNNARRVLRWREEHGDEVAGMTSVGWSRARQLANNARVSRDTVAKMASFNRHRQNAEVAPEHEGEPWKDAGHVAWLGWGGTTGVDWARGITGASDGD